MVSLRHLTLQTVFQTREEFEMDKGSLLETILNSSNQMIQVSDAETYQMLYANNATIRFAGRDGASYMGQPCYGDRLPLPFLSTA